MTGTDQKPKQHVVSENSVDTMKKSSDTNHSESIILNREQLKIINWLKEVKFKKQLFGGIDEQDMWKKINHLNEMYEAALNAERIRYDALLEKQNLSEIPKPHTENLVKETASYE